MSWACNCVRYVHGYIVSTLCSAVKNVSLVILKSAEDVQKSDLESKSMDWRCISSYHISCSAWLFNDPSIPIISIPLLELTLGRIFPKNDIF